MKLFKILFSCITLSSLLFLITNAWSERGNVYDTPAPPVDPSTPEKACYNALTDCIKDCDRMFPAPYLSEPNEDFPGCVQLCNKTANLCIADIKR